MYLTCLQVLEPLRFLNPPLRHILAGLGTLEHQQFEGFHEHQGLPE